MSEPIQYRPCTTCKHYVYKENVAHGNLCKRFDEKLKPCAEVRGSNAGICGGRGKFWEPA